VRQSHERQVFCQMYVCLSQPLGVHREDRQVRRVAQLRSAEVAQGRADAVRGDLSGAEKAGRNGVRPSQPQRQMRPARVHDQGDGRGENGENGHHPVKRNVRSRP
jgi:hypothetical protein